MTFSMPKPGDVLADKFRIDAVIGRGGMSVVYRATHLHLDQQVAIKVLSPATPHFHEHVLRLKREACAASRIRSEHAARVHDIVVDHAGMPYLVMEHLRGSDLAAILRERGPLPVALVVECIMQACEAVAEAHGMGIIHRDLKPANLFLTTAVDGSPSVKVLDFGVSRLTRIPPINALTNPGIVLGTPEYMAPEQMESSDLVDARSDIWALGAILYELLVGTTPFAGQSLPQLFVQILRSKTPRVSDHRDGVPRALETAILRCLAVEPSGRFQSVGELAWALARVGNVDGRKSAARIARVFDRSMAESTGELAAPEPAPAASGKGSRFKRLSAALAALGFGFALVVAAMPSPRGLAMRWIESGHTVGASLFAPDDGALRFGPMVRAR